MRTRLWQQLARDETGSVNSAELVLIVTILVIGMMVGLSSFRDSAVTEFADLAQAVANLNQSYSFSGITADLGDSGVVTTAGSSFSDARDFCDTSGGIGTGPPPSKCVFVFCNNPPGE